MEKNKAYEILNKLKEMYPNAKCELNYSSAFELLVAVSLSAQTTDKRVNMVTVELFKRYKDASELANANYSDVYEIIKSLGLATTKSQNIIALSKKLVEVYKGKVPSTREELCTLPGIGRKSANVVLSEYFKKPALAVDTHVKRCANRLGLSEEDDVLKIEKDLCSLFNEEDYYSLHHSLIFFGRYFCKSVNPVCDKCPFINICKRKRP